MFDVTFDIKNMFTLLLFVLLLSKKLVHELSWWWASTRETATITSITFKGESLQCVRLCIYVKINKPQSLHRRPYPPRLSVSAWLSFLKPSSSDYWGMLDTVGLRYSPRRPSWLASVLLLFPMFCIFHFLSPLVRDGAARDAARDETGISFQFTGLPLKQTANV